MKELPISDQPLKKTFWLGWTVLSAWAILLASGLLAHHWLAGEARSFVGTWGRMGSSIALVILACLAWWQVVQPARRYAAWIAVGMLLGTIGDFFNANLMSFVPLKNGTLGAIMAFGLGHLCYMAAIGGELKKFKALAMVKLLSSVLIWQLIGLISWFFIVYPASTNTGLIWPALGYTLLLAGTAGMATGLACHANRMWAVAVGAGLFLAIGLFGGSFPFRSEAVWLTYGPGQMLIVISSWLVATHTESLSTNRHYSGDHDKCTTIQS
jgi:hypothetical protein